MKYSVSPREKAPAYLQLYEALRRDITEGLFPYGVRLPSKRILSEETGLSVITVEHAYALLCEEGYLEARERSGYFVIYRADEQFSPPPRKAPPAEAQTSQSGETFPFSVYARIVRKTLSDYPAEVLKKSTNGGHPLLREELSRYLARNRGIYASPEQIVIGAGAEYFYGLLVQMLGRERIYGLEDPSYEQIARVYEACGAKVELLPLTANGIESKALSASHADVLHITPYRSFPSGATADANKKREYLSWAERQGRLLIEDDVESEFSLSHKPEESLFSLCRTPCVLYLNTFSLTIAPAIRMAYLVLPEALLPLYEEKAGFYSCTVPTLEQLVIACVLREGEYERHVNRQRRKKRKAQ